MNTYSTPSSIPVTLPWSKAEWQETSPEQIALSPKLEGFITSWQNRIPPARGTEYVKHATLAAILGETNPLKLAKHRGRAAAQLVATRSHMSAGTLKAMLCGALGFVSCKSPRISTTARVEMALTVASYSEFVAKEILKPSRNDQKDINALLDLLRAWLVKHALDAVQMQLEAA